MNQNFGRVVDHEIRYAKDTLVLADGTVVSRPTEAQYLAANQYRVIDVPPVAPEGFEAVHDDWVEDAASKTATRLYRVKPVPAPVVRYSKLKLITAAKEAGKWDALKGWIEAAGIYDEWLVCQYLASDYQGFDAMVGKIVQSGIATLEEVKRLLAASEDDGR